MVQISGYRVMSDSPRAFRAYQASIRVAAAKRAEGNRRSGGIKTQKAMVKACKYQKTGFIKDSIVDEHSLLLFIQFSAERPKQNRRGGDILGTFLGASQLEKLLVCCNKRGSEVEAGQDTAR